MLMDARSIPNGSVLECDLCLVGAGFAGIAIADRLRGSGLSILLLESGGFNAESASQDLYRGELDGHKYFRLDACRWRVFGGGSTRWGGWCRPLDPADYTERAWLAHSGWPIDHHSLTSYEDDAAKLFELPDARFDLSRWRDRLPEPLVLDGTEFENTVFQHSPETNFAEKYGPRIIEAANVRMVLHANLTEIRLSADSRRIGRLDVASLSGNKFSVSPKAVVLAAGGIENARLLLSSRADRPAGLGNEHDLVGRYFMEHLHVPAGNLLMAPGYGDNKFFRKAIFEDVRLRGVITPTAAAVERNRLLPTSIAVENASYYMGTPYVGWAPRVTIGPMRFHRGLQIAGFARTAKFLKHVAHRADSLSMRIHTWKMARASARGGGASDSRHVYSLYFRAEQAPDPANRVMLSERNDAFGRPQTRLEWGVKAFDAASIMGWLAIFDRDVRKLGLGSVVAPPDDWPNHIVGGPHHMGTTRMSSDPRLGVVDADCRVHSVDNLYIAGSSVFVTSGYTNPTFTIVTLALRLADTLRKRLLA